MTEPTTAERVYAEQVHELYRLSRSAYVGTLITSSILVFALWGLVSSSLLGAWLCAMYALTAARYLLYRVYSDLRPAPADARTWERRFVIGAGAAGLLWGVAGSVLYPVSSLPHQFLVIFLIGGMAVAAMVILAPLKQAFFAYMAPAFLPMIYVVFAQGTTLHMFMGVLMIVFLGVMLGTVPIVSRMMRDALRAKFESSALVGQLSEANRELSGRIVTQQRDQEALRQTTEKFEALIDASPLAIIMRDAEGRVESWNPAAERMFGWTEEEARGRHRPTIPPERKDEVLRSRGRILLGDSLSDFETVRLRKDGTPVYLSISAAPVHDASGRAVGFLSLLTDVTKRKRAELRLQMEHAMTRILAESRSVEEAIPQVLRTFGEATGWVYGARWDLDRANQMLRCAETWCVASPELEEFVAFNRPRTQRTGDGRGPIHRVWETNGPVWITDMAKENVRRAEAARKAGLHAVFAFPILIGEEFYGVIELFGRDVRPPDQDLMQNVHTIGSQIGQFIARRAAEQNLRFVASHDPLTGLFNRSMFSERLQQALAQAARFERSLAVLFIDLDGFKLINDTAGHNGGDALLVELATRLRTTLREGDVIGRMGGDEFVVLIEEYAEAAQVAEVAKKVLETLARPFQLQGREFEVTASLGISLYPEDGKDAQTLLKSADTAMYLVKQQGKNSFRFYAPQMNIHLIERLTLESALRRAIDRGELLLLYQPKVGVRDGEMSGVEALVRWQHPTQGMISPSEFMPVAEDAGLMAAIGEWVLYTACRQLRAWREQGLATLRVAVNLSPRQFSQDGLIQIVREALHQMAVDPSRLELEIREEMVLRNPERAMRLLAQFRELGVRLVIDDFGTGYSSLNYLKRLHVDSVKIDRSLILALPQNTDSAALTRGVVAMAHSLGIAVTAEGVESREQWEFLNQLGCEEMQGNYFSAPVLGDLVAGIARQPAGAGQRASVRPLRSRRGEGGTESEP